MKMCFKRFGPVALVAMVALTLAPQAFATAELRITDGTNTVDIVDQNGAGTACSGAVTGCSDANGLINVVTFVGSIGTWNLNVSTGSSHGALNGADLDLNSVNNTTAAGTLTISFSDDGFPAATGHSFSVGGTFTTGTPTVSFSEYSGATKFATTTQLGTTLSFTASPFSGSTSGTSLAGQTALTEVAVLAFNGAGGTSFDAQLEPVPEPASVALFGGVLLCSVTMIRRKLGRR